MERLGNWWVSGSEIRLVAIPVTFPSISPYVSSCFTNCFASLFGYFSRFPWCFSLFPILGLTPVKLIHWKLPNCFWKNSPFLVITEICSVSQWRFHGSRWIREFIQRNCSVSDCLLEKASPYYHKVASCKIKIAGEWLKSKIMNVWFNVSGIQNSSCLLMIILQMWMRSLDYTIWLVIKKDIYWPFCLCSFKKNISFF